ncbi:MAG: hypothetical protein J5717_06855 [Lachnospiraceae bacterium]|nr:hypothetical protein [Lachnospiraceae bacterium]
MKKIVSVIAVSAFLLLTLAGCGAIPDMDVEQEEMISEYAVSLLLKYDSENHSRLVNVDNYVTAYETAKRIHDQAEEAYYNKLAEEENKRREEAERQEELNNSYSQETPSQGGGSEYSEEGSGSSGNRGDGNGGATVVDTQSIEEFLGVGAFTFAYAGFDVMNDYPEDSMDFVPYISASEGGELCVVYFNVTNNSSEASTLDIIDIVPMTYFKLAVNGGSFKSVVRTILEDDIAVYSGTFAAGETKRLVLIAEIREGTIVDNLELRITKGNDALTKSLR